MGVMFGFIGDKGAPYFEKPPHKGEKRTLAEKHPPLFAYQMLYDALLCAGGSQLCAMEPEYLDHKKREIAGVTVKEVYDVGLNLDRFARLCARSVAEFWDAPEDPVLRFLDTGEETLRLPAVQIAANNPDKHLARSAAMHAIMIYKNEDSCLARALHASSATARYFGTVYGDYADQEIKAGRAAPLQDWNDICDPPVVRALESFRKQFPAIVVRGLKL